MKYDYIDIHTHVNIAAYNDDYKDVIENARQEGVALMNIGTQIDTPKRAVELAEEFEDGVYGVVGLHPVHTSKSFHDEKELGKESKEFTSRGEVFDTDLYQLRYM